MCIVYELETDSSISCQKLRQLYFFLRLVFNVESMVSLKFDSQNETTLCSAFCGRFKRDTVRICCCEPVLWRRCCWTPPPGTRCVDRYLLPAGLPACATAAVN